MKHSRFWLVVMPILLAVFLLAIPTLVVLQRMGLLTPSPTAQVEMTASERAPELVFVADYDFDPYSYIENEQPNGMDVEISYEIANRLGMRPRIEFGTWSECKTKIKNGEADVLLGLEIFVDGAATGTLKSIPVGSDTLSIIGFDTVTDAAALSGKKVGVSFGSALMELFKLNCEYVQYFTYSEMFEALNKGEIDYGICHASVATRLIEKNQYTFGPSLVLMESFPTMGIRDDEPDLLAKINQALEEMSADGTIASLRDKWIITNVQNKTVGDVLHYYNEFFIMYTIFSVVILCGYFVAAISIRSSKVQKEALKTVQGKQKELEDALEMANTASRAKTTFLSNMSHDIRTPMNAIIGFTNMAEKNMDNKELLKDNLEKTKQAGNLLLTLINNILDVSRIEAGQEALEETFGDVQLSFVNIESTLKQIAEAKQVQLSFEFSDITDRYVYVDIDKCNRVLMNVVTNAIKYTPAGGYVKVKCEQRGRREDGRGIFRYTVEDNGIGMSEEFQAHVFEQFTRERSSTKSGIQGTGLGMALCKSLVTMMGGTIGCQSRQNVGTTFTVILPLRLQNKDEKPEYIDPDSHSLVADDEAKQIISFNGMHLLLVDDNELNREIAVDLLSELGFIITTAEDGNIAVEIMEQAKPGDFDLVLMDIQMPTMDGYEATRHIRALEQTGVSDVPIVAMTANAFAEDRERALEAGMNAHLAKPIDVNKVKSVLSTVLTQHKE